MRLFMHPASNTCRPIINLIADNNLPIDQEVVDIMTGEHHKEPYVSLNPSRQVKPDDTPNPHDIGNVHHLAFAVSHATIMQAGERLKERGVPHSGIKDRGFMDSIYFRDPLGQLIELAAFRFEPPAGSSHGEVLLEAHRIRVAKGDYNIGEVHLADAIEVLVARGRQSLSEDRSPKNPYQTKS